MPSDSSEFDLLKPPIEGSGKPPHWVIDGVFAFPPNRHTLGGTAYLVNDPEGNILVDCPAWEESNRAFLEQQGGVRWLMLTHRGAHARVRELQQVFTCEVVVQEQEAYLLPDLTVTTWQHSIVLSSHSRALWTPGHSPGSACLYHWCPGAGLKADINLSPLPEPRTLQPLGGMLFTGRHLLPDPQGQPVPLHLSKTFHWPRQLRSIERLRHEFSPATLHWICPGANTGYLRGKRAIDQAYERLCQIDLEGLRLVKPGL